MMKMLKISSIILVVGMLVSLVPVRDAGAMNNESAALLTGAIVLLGLPVMNAITNEMARTQPQRVDYQAHERVVYRRVYVYSERSCGYSDSSYERGWCDEMRRIQRQEYYQGRRDAGRYYYGY